MFWLALTTGFLCVFVIAIIFFRLFQINKEIHLKKYREKEAGLPELLNYAALVDDGIILNKNGSLMTAFLYKGTDDTNSTIEHREYVSECLNKVLSNLDNEWMIHVDAVRHPTSTYFPKDKSFFPDVI